MERPGPGRVVRRVACALVAMSCFAAATAALLFALFGLLADVSVNEHWTILLGGMATAFACVVAAVLLGWRIGGKKGVCIRAVVSITCLAVGTLLMTWSWSSQTWWMSVPLTLASGLIWLTPGTLPAFLCRKCRYDMRGLPQAGDAAKCPECGTPRGSVRPSGDEVTPRVE